MLVTKVFWFQDLYVDCEHLGVRTLYFSTLHLFIHHCLRPHPLARLQGKNQHRLLFNWFAFWGRKSRYQVSVLQSVIEEEQCRSALDELNKLVYLDKKRPKRYTWQEVNKQLLKTMTFFLRFRLNVSPVPISFCQMPGPLFPFLNYCFLSKFFI